MIVVASPGAHLKPGRARPRLVLARLDGLDLAEVELVARALDLLLGHPGSSQLVGRVELVHVVPVLAAPADARVEVDVLGEVVVDRRVEVPLDALGVLVAGERRREAVVVRRLEAVDLVLAERGRDAEVAELEAGRAERAHLAVLAHAAVEEEVHALVGRGLRDDVDHAAGRVGAVADALVAAQHLDALQVEGGDVGEVGHAVDGADVAGAVHEDLRVLGRHALDRDDRVLALDALLGPDAREVAHDVAHVARRERLDLLLLDHLLLDRRVLEDLGGSEALVPDDDLFRLAHGLLAAGGRGSDHGERGQREEQPRTHGSRPLPMANVSTRPCWLRARRGGSSASP